MKLVYKFLLLILLIFTLLFIWCEFLIYYAHLLLFCSWPSDSKFEDKQSKVMVLSDTHLLGTLKGHWFDKLRREWQMYRSFQSAITLFSPEFVFILGDIFDEGQWASSEDFQRYVDRFNQLFHVPVKTKLYAVTGNHDIGFHYWTNHILISRFDKAMNTSTVDYFYLQNNIAIIRINSIALENDGCELCSKAIRRIENLSYHFEKLRKNESNFMYPILLTHFPMYRLNESLCIDDDSPEHLKQTAYREGLDCLSKDISEYLLKRLKPRFILNGHVHHSCHRQHFISNDQKTPVTIDEYTVASFSWRNKINPSFLLIELNSTKHIVSKCSLPSENMVISTYIIVFLFLLIAFLISLIHIIKHKVD